MIEMIISLIALTLTTVALLTYVVNLFAHRIKAQRISDQVNTLLGVVYAEPEKLNTKKKETK